MGDQLKPLKEARITGYRGPSAAAGFYIADEPDTHLHPAAVQSVRNWLSRLSETATAVLVATHSPALLDSAARQVHRVLVTREDELTTLRELTGALDQELARVSESLGISAGELLLMTRLVLFLEGPHDQMILEEWFGQDLRAAGVRVYPVHGADNMPGLAESEITAALGIRIATLRRSLRPERQHGYPPNDRREGSGQAPRQAPMCRCPCHRKSGLERPCVIPPCPFMVKGGTGR